VHGLDFAAKGPQRNRRGDLGVVGGVWWRRQRRGGDQRTRPAGAVAKPFAQPITGSGPEPVANTGPHTYTFAHAGTDAGADAPTGAARATGHD
jgi:hypothetical protein